MGLCFVRPFRLANNVADHYLLFFRPHAPLSSLQPRSTLLKHHHYRFIFSLNKIIQNRLRLMIVIMDWADLYGPFNNYPHGPFPFFFSLWAVGSLSKIRPWRAPLLIAFRSTLWSLRFFFFFYLCVYFYFKKFIGKPMWYIGLQFILKCFIVKSFHWNGTDN